MSEVIQLGNCMSKGKRDNPNQGRVYEKMGLSPCLTSMTGGNRQPMIIEEPKLVGGLGEKVSNGGTQYYNQDRVYDSDGVAVATSFQPNYLVVVMRCRNPNNPSDRTPGIELEQRLEPNPEGICNTLTTVQKDNLVLENIVIGGMQEHQSIKDDGVCTTITTRPEGKKTAILPVVERYRIRKLTPRECFRLMNVEEEQFNRAEKVVSNSQLYKIAGNAIVVSVLCALFSQLGIQGKKKWNDMTEKERLQIVHKGTIFEGKIWKE